MIGTIARNKITPGLDKPILSLYLRNEIYRLAL